MQAEEGDPEDAQHEGSDFDVRPKSPEGMPEDLFGGLTLSKADEGSSLI